MGWPQWVVLVLMVLEVMHKFIAGVKDDRMSSTDVTLAIFLYVGYLAAYAAVLHAGGFW